MTLPTPLIESGASVASGGGIRGVGMLFLKRKGKQETAPAPEPMLPDAPAQEYSLKLYLMGRSSESVRMQGADVGGALPAIVDRMSKSRIEIIEPLPQQFRDAAPNIERIDELEQWTEARRDLGPVGRHALYVLESVDALDMTVDTFICGLLRGTTEASGSPDYQAIVGGIATRWDEASGDLLARAVVGWGGKGLRGDTDRHAQSVINAIYAELHASRHSVGATAAPRPQPSGGRSVLVCAHCGFEAATTQAFVCSRCGMRLSRGA